MRSKRIVHSMAESPCRKESSSFSLAAAYPAKFMWGSDSPYYSYVAMLGSERIALISTYAREVAALKAQPPEVLERIANKNIRAWLKLKDESILAGK